MERARDIRFTYSGRAGIYQYLARLRAGAGGRARSTVLVPSFHCPTVVDPALHAGYDVRFYAVDRDMRVSAADFLAKLDGDVAAAIFIAYFGFSEMDPALVAACRERGVRVIEDCAHSFLRADPMRLAESGADATVYSFWKLVPSAVGGGVLVARGAEDAPWPAQGSPSKKDSVSRAKMLLREVIDESREARQRTGDAVQEEEAKPAVRKPAEEAYPYLPAVSSWRMPMSARMVLERADLATLVATRRAHYEMLANGLKANDEIVPLRPQLAPHTCPWGFAVRLHRRPERDYLLRARGVPVFTFGETLHPLLFERHPREREMLASVLELRDTTLTISIHQGLTSEQMSTVVAILNDAAGQWAR
jgi:dTDP-4-amino-4,6-dideoxygalactose transaminase